MSRPSSASPQARAGAVRGPASSADARFTAVCGELKQWMFDVALPFWVTHGLDPIDGGFVEKFDLAGRPWNKVKRVRVVCRQTYVFSHASLLGWSGGREVAERGFRYLVEKAWMAGSGGFARTLDPQGRVIDPTLDLYDHAFVLFAFAWRHRATGDPEALKWAHRTLDIIEDRLRPESGRGFLADAGTREERLQNPHMHLLEAAIALIESSGDDRFRALADDLVDLFEGRLFDARTGTLAEHFDTDWRRMGEPASRVVEPGHQFEWAWILVQQQRLTGRNNSRLATELARFAEERGVDPLTRATINAVNENGAVLDGGSRTWPNTERMKAAVALYDLTGADPTERLVSSGRLLLDRYLAGPFPGGWLDAFDAAGRSVVDWVPSSTLYHLFLAFAETLRVEAELAAAEGGLT